MTNKEFTINLSESELNTLIRILKQKLIEVSKEVIKGLEPLETSSIFSLDETNIELLKDNVDDLNYYLNLCSRLLNTKYSLEQSIC